MVTQEFLAEWYEQEALRNPQSQMYRELHAKQRFATVTHLLGDVIKGKDVLDVGCGEGLYTLWCVHNGADWATGFDISERNITAAKSNAKLDDVLNVTFEVQSWDDLFDCGYDVVLATEVFEHALDPQALAVKCQAAGKVLVASAPISEPSVPNDPWKLQGHLHCFRVYSFVSMFEGVTYYFHDGLYCYVMARA